MIELAAGVIVTPNRDDTAVLVTLTARELNSTATIVAGGREQQNLHLLRQGGADELTDDTTLVAIVRDGVRLPPEAVERSLVRPGDRLVVVRETSAGQ